MTLLLLRVRYEVLKETLNEGWFTGFCELDGSVCIQERPNRLVRLQLGQKDESPLRYIYDCVGHGVLGHSRTRDSNYLAFNGRKSVSLLKVLSRHVVSSYFLGRLNVVLREFGMSEAHGHGITLDWFVGSWDAEGTSALGGFPPTLYVAVYQKEREVLDAICHLTRCGSVSRNTNQNGEPMHRWTIGGKKAFEIAQMLLERSQCDGKRQVLSEHINECLERRGVREWMKNNPEQVRELVRKGGVTS